MYKYIIILLLCLSGCVTQQRCFEKFPPVTTVEYRDTTITVYIPATDTVLKYGYITDTLYVHNGTAHSIVWVKRDTIFNEVFSSDTTLQIRLDSALQVIKQRNTVIITEKAKAKQVLNRVIVISIILLLAIILIKYVRHK